MLTMLTMTIKLPALKIKGRHINTSVPTPNLNPKLKPGPNPNTNPKSNPDLLKLLTLLIGSLVHVFIKQTSPIPTC